MVCISLLTFRSGTTLCLTCPFVNLIYSAAIRDRLHKHWRCCQSIWKDYVNEISIVCRHFLLLREKVILDGKKDLLCCYLKLISLNYTMFIIQKVWLLLRAGSESQWVLPLLLPVLPIQIWIFKSQHCHFHLWGDF